MGIDAGGMIHKIGIKAGGPDLVLIQIAGELVNQGAHHLQVAQFLSTCRGDKREHGGAEKGVLQWQKTAIRPFLDCPMLF